MEAGRSGSESQAQPGWRGAPLHRVRASEEARMGPQDPAGRQAGGSSSTRTLQSWGQWACPPPRLSGSAAHQVHPCGGGSVNGRRVACPYPGISQSFSKYPLTHCPMDPSSPLWRQESRVRVLVQWCFCLRALDPCKNTHPPGDGQTHSSSFLSPPTGTLASPPCL